MSSETARPRICLNMIVRNESKLIEHCLLSVIPYVDTWVIIDTGSTDNTMEIIKRVMAGKPGVLLEDTWVDFGTNRTSAVHAAQTASFSGPSSYLLFMDADDAFVAPEGFKWPALTKDAYELWMEYGSYRYVRQVLVSNKLTWRWVGVLHEYPESFPPTASVERLEVPYMRVSTDGARSQDPEKYVKDAEVLRRALVAKPGDTRYMFYLAQSLRDAGMWLDALEAYEVRAEAGGWEEEAFVSLLEIARIKERLTEGVVDAEVADAYLAAFEFRPSRAEPLVDLAQWYRLQGRYQLAYLYASQADKINLLNDRLFLDKSYYEWRATDEMAIAAYWVGRFDECSWLCGALLSLGQLPDNEVGRIKANKKFADEKIPPRGLCVGIESATANAEPTPKKEPYHVI